MKYYSDDTNIIYFQRDKVWGEYFKERPEEYRMFQYVVNMCYCHKWNPFVVLKAFCCSDKLHFVSHNSDRGFFYYHAGDTLLQLKRFGLLQPYTDDWDPCIFSWICSVYVTARYEMDMSYYEIACCYPVNELYKVFNPLHEMSEINFLSRMSFQREDLIGCFINGKYYLNVHDIPNDLKYLLQYEDAAKEIKERINVNTVFFHLVSEENGYLSNWYLSDFTIDGVTFNCVEQFLMWKKAMLFNDTATADAILREKDPSEQKKLGRKVQGYTDAIWAANRYNIAVEGLLAKFTQNQDLREKFLSTSGSFAECAVHDSVWGIGLSMNDPKRFDKNFWRGQNLLGFALTQVYDKLNTKTVLPIER